MTLGQKIIALFLVVGLGFLGGSYAVLKMSVFPAFAEFERESSENTVERVTKVLENNLQALKIFSIEYAWWDQTYEFAQGRRPEFIEESLDAEYWVSVDVDMVLMFDSEGVLLYGHVGHPSDGRSLRLEEEIVPRLTTGHPLVTHQETSDIVQGLLRTRSGVMQVVAAPILHSNGKGVIGGSAIVGAFLDPETVASIGQRASADITLYSSDTVQATDSIKSAMDSLLRNPEKGHFVTDDDRVREYLLLNDVLGEPAAVLEVSTLRRITRIGSKTVQTAMLFLLIAIAVFLLAAWLFMRRTIVAPLKRLTRHMLNITETGDLHVQIETDRADEIGMMAREFDKLTKNLSTAQKESDQARRDSEKARDEALAMSRTKSEFLARMSHEIRTPMNGVLGMTELLQDTALDAKQARFTRIIYESAGSLLNIINDILDFSKIEAGKLQLELIDISLRDLLEETSDSLAGMAHRKGLELISIPPRNLQRTIRTDPGRLRQVLTNLVSNAIKFTNEGEIVVRVTATEVSATNWQIHFAVRDTGIGIDTAKQSEVFESFAQEDGSTTRLYGGTGLGLAISTQIVELMGGKLEVDSVQGRGSTFFFTIPVAVSSTLSPVTGDQPHFVAGNRILVVDDNDTNREILQHQLSSWRAQAECVASAASALDALQAAVTAEQPYDLAILDMHMPRVDGLGLARAIRQNAAFDDLKLLVLSSVAQPIADAELKSLYIAGQLAKPIRQSQLYDSLVMVLGGDTAAHTHSRRNVAAVKALSGCVLLAEDNLVNQAVATGMLESFGLTVEIAADGQEAVQKAAAGSFDVILMDCQMPVMDGFQATAEIRRFEQTDERERTPIVAATANALDGDRERCIDSGMDEFLTKPFTIQQLHAVLSPFLQPASHSQAENTRNSAMPGVALPAQSEEAPAIDAAVLARLAALQSPGSEDLVQRVVVTFLESSAELSYQLREAVSTGNGSLLRSVAHELKSSSANVGALCLAGICQRLETMAAEEDLTDAPFTQECYDKEYARVVATLQESVEASPA